SLRELMQNKTTIVIAHRLSTLLDMDRILVFDDGKIVQDGSHSELSSKDGLYKTLWNTQINGFII
ncbi:MAG: ABC transporter ATP-binding protein, partial [Rickettsiales bacterium]